MAHFQGAFEPFRSKTKLRQAGDEARKQTRNVRERAGSKEPATLRGCTAAQRFHLGASLICRAAVLANQEAQKFEFWKICPCSRCLGPA